MAKYASFLILPLAAVTLGANALSNMNPISAALAADGAVQTASATGGMEAMLVIVAITTMIGLRQWAVAPWRN